MPFRYRSERERQAARRKCAEARKKKQKAERAASKKAAQASRRCVGTVTRPRRIHNRGKLTVAEHWQAVWQCRRLTKDTSGLCGICRKKARPLSTHTPVQNARKRRGLS